MLRDATTPMDWVRCHYKASAQGLDADEFVDGLSVDVRISSPSGTVAGRAAVRDLIEQMRADGMVSMEHVLNGLWAPEPDVVIAEGTVSYRFANHVSAPAPVATVFRWHRGEVADVRVYMSAQVHNKP